MPLAREQSMDACQKCVKPGNIMLSERNHAQGNTFGISFSK